jgi:4-amino-4-deoxy-L-arabinose transferase-like glycosyltransferase
MSRIPSARRWLLVLLLLFTALSILYARQIPLFESPDESSHLKVIDYIARTHRLPPPSVPEQRITTGPRMAESLRYRVPPRYYAPPLYHALGALLTADVAMTDLPDRLVPNPAWEQAWSPTRDADPWNKNVYAHLPGETLRESPTVRAAARLRALSLACSLVTLLCTYQIAQCVLPQHPARAGIALGSTALVALNPQFIAGATAVSNDPLLIAIFSLGVWGCLRAMQDAAPWPRWAALGALVGIGALTKQTALLLVPLAGLALLWQRAPAPHPWRTRLLDGTAFGVTALLVGGGWYVYNALAFGDPLGLAPHLDSQMVLPRFTLQHAGAIFETYWAGFGWALLSMPRWFYGGITALVIVAVAGWLRARRRGPTQAVADGRGWALLALALGLNVASLVRWAIATGAPYGRLLHPSIAPTAVLLARGLAQWRGARAFWLGAVAVTAVGLVIAALIPGCVLKPAFAAPHVAAPPPSATRHEQDLTGDVTLLGSTTTPPAEATLHPGDALRVTLYWEAQAAPRQRYTTWVQLAPRDPTQRVATSNRWLGGTLYPSDLWRAGDRVREQHILELPRHVAAPRLYWVRLGLTDAGGPPTPALTLGPWRVRPRGWERAPAPAQALDARLGPALRLHGYDLARQDDALILTLHWEAKAPPSADYHVFVHAVDRAGDRVAQHDGPPDQGRYPTAWWLPGDRVHDAHPLPLPDPLPAGLRLRVGMYRPTTGRRLPAYDAQGQRLPDDAVTFTPPAP